MPTPAYRQIGLSPALEKKQRISVRQAAELKNISEDTFRRHYRHLIKQELPGRQSVVLGDVLEE